MSEGEQQGGHIGPTPGPGAPQPCWPRLAQVWPTWAGSDSATLPIYSSRMENPKYSEKIPERSPYPPPPSRRNLCSSRHPAGGEIVIGGLLHHHARLRCAA